MILLSELFEMLATGEFSNMALSRDHTGSIDEGEYSKVVNHINLGLVEIFKRFNLLQREVTIHADPSVSTYSIQPKFAVDYNLVSLMKYLEKPDDYDGYFSVVKLLDIYDTDGTNYPMNDRHCEPAIMAMSHDTIKITGLEAATELCVIYQSWPTKIVVDDDLDPKEFNVSIPEIVVEALLYYVASRVYKPTGSNDSTANADKSAGYQQQYELACTKIGLYGLDTQDNDTRDKITEGDWA